MTPDKLILSPLRKALDMLKKALAEPETDLVRDAVIQRFEYTYELAWKMTKRYLEKETGNRDIGSVTRKDLFREAARHGLIQDVEAWFEYHRARNETVHTYDESTAEEVYRVAKRFAGDAEHLFKELERRNA